MTFLETLLKRAGRTEPPPRDFRPRSEFPSRRSVSYSGELRRIESLPRRIWEDEPGLRMKTETISFGLKTPSGQMELWPIQARAIFEAFKEGGGFFPIGVGRGKALISLLAPVLMDCERPILFVPAALRDQTLDFVIPRMSKHWKLTDRLVVVGYSELSLAKNATMLEDYRPDLIILDECHSVARPEAGRTRRLVRYFREHPETKCLAMSGTVSSRSLKDFSHIIQWCLKDRTPLPRTWRELSEWADAIDEKVPDDQRAAPGALLRFCEPGENVRQGFRRRLVETPGVVASAESELGTSLQILKYRSLDLPSGVADKIEAMRKTWTTPNGDIITNAVDLWRHIRELSLGFWYRWDPAPPRKWLSARKDWKAFVRETLKHNRRGLDTELQVWNECEKKLPEVFRKWRAIKDSFKIRTVPVWENDFALVACAKWLAGRTEENRGIVWIEHRAFGEKLSKKVRYPYFGAGDSRILSTDARGVLASIRAHSEGKNLERFSSNLVVAPMASGKAWEQLLGRTHREGQKADVVHCEIFLHVPELREAFEQARADAQYLEDTFGNRQKLNYADIVTDPDHSRSGDFPKPPKGDNKE